MSPTPCPNCGLTVELLRRAGGYECPECRWSMSPSTGRDAASESVADPALTVPGLPQEWQVEGILGEGGMGTVWRARNRLTEERVAIKCMRDSLAGHEEALQRFLREVKVLSRLAHPGIVRLVHAGLLATGTPYLVLELIEGATLRDVLPGLPADRAFRIALAIAEAMEFTHARGVVHRDLKPENVLIDGEGRLRVADFGLAGLNAEWGETQRVMKTRSGTTMGTPGYMAPEQLVSASEAGPAADVYALGAMLFEMLSGRLPHGRESVATAVRGLPASIDALVASMLLREPDSRPTASQVRLALQLQCGPTGGSTSESSQPWPEWTHPKDGSLMIRVPACRFRMGTDEGPQDERPAHDVSLASYSIGRFAVTWKQYRTFCHETGRAEPPDPGFFHDDLHPVVNVSWYDAAAYCAWAGLRLPTEAEWEYAARGGDERPFPWGVHEPDETRANFDSRHGGTRPVGHYPAGISFAGCWEMAGNVWEWTADWYAPYIAGPACDPSGPAAGGRRAVRGGGWCYDASSLRSTCRESLDPASRIFEFGFRVAGPG